MKKFLMALVAVQVFVVASSQVSHAQAFSSYWNHNGSIMGLAAQGNQRAFVYVQPRPGMAELGVQGESFFEGVSDGHAYYGTAFAFSPRCGKLPFPVSGPISPDQLHVVLFGNMPRTDPVTCQIVRYDNVELHFDYVGR